MARSNIQVSVERQREIYSHLRLPLLSQLAFIHGLSVRDLADIFGTSKSYIAEVFNHRKLPSLELAIRISRYFEVGTDDLFSWRIDDDGSRRPLVIELPNTRELVRLDVRNRKHGSLELIKMVAETLRQKREKEAKRANQVHGVCDSDPTGQSPGICDAGEEREEGAGHPDIGQHQTETL